MAVGIVDRVRRILLTPKDEWAAIGADTMDSGGIWKGWVVPLAGLSALAGTVGGIIFGAPFESSALAESFGIEVMSTMDWISQGIVGFVISLVGVRLVSFLIQILAPTFGATVTGNTGLRVAAYSYTAAWVAGLFAIIPALALLGILGLYSIYLLHVGLKTLTGVPEDKAVGYTASVFISAFLASLVLGWVGSVMT